MVEKIVIIEEWSCLPSIYCFEYLGRFGILKTRGGMLGEVSYDKLEIGEGKILLEASYGRLEKVLNKDKFIIFKDTVTNKLGLLIRTNIILEPIYDSIDEIEKSKIISEKTGFTSMESKWYFLKQGNNGILMDITDGQQIAVPKASAINQIYQLGSYKSYVFIIVEGSEQWYGISIGSRRGDVSYIPILKINQLIEKKLFYIISIEGAGIFDIVGSKWIIPLQYDEIIELTKSLSVSQLLELDKREFRNGLQVLEGVGSIWRVKRNNKYGIVHLRGTVSGSCEILNIGNNEKRLRFFGKGIFDPKETFNTREAIEVLEPSYDRISDFKLICGVYIAKVIRKGYYGYIDIGGTELVPCRFEESKLRIITDFKGNKNVYVYVRESEKQGIYKLGEGLIVSCIFEDIIRCIIRQKYKIIVFMEGQKEKWGIIKLNGQCEYVVVKSKMYGGMYYLIEHNEKYGVADKHLNILLPGTYNSQEKCEKWIEEIEKYIFKNELSPLIQEYMKFEQIRTHITSIDGLRIKDMNAPSEKVQIQAVRQNGLAIKFIDRPNEEVQVEAVRQNTLAIKYIEMQATRAQLIAVRKDITNLKYIKDQIRFLQSNKIQIKSEIWGIMNEFVPRVQDLIRKQMEIQGDQKWKEQLPAEISAYGTTNNENYTVYEDGMWSVKKKGYNIIS